MSIKAWRVCVHIKSDGRKEPSLVIEDFHKILVLGQIVD